MDFASRHLALCALRHAAARAGKVNWFANLLARQVLPPGCPGPNCGWRMPITVALLATSYYVRGHIKTEPAGRLCRCPMCQTLYVETHDKVLRCGPPVNATPAVKPEDVRPPRQPRQYPELDDDMLRGFATDEPR
jgi:hypothetical protein